MRIYISGPISKKPNGNQDAFYAAAEEIIYRLDFPVNPHDVCMLIPPGSPWVDYMRKCISALSECDSIMMLPGWLWSQGARVEWLIARILKLKVEYK